MRSDAEADTGPTGLATTTLESPGSGISSPLAFGRDSPALECLAGRHGLCWSASGAPGVRRKARPGNSLLRHSPCARPGITGWAQINYGYGSSVEEAKEKLRYDLYYIRNVSVILDLIIVFRYVPCRAPWSRRALISVEETCSLLFAGHAAFIEAPVRTTVSFRRIRPCTRPAQSPRSCESRRPSEKLKEPLNSR